MKVLLCQAFSGYKRVLDESSVLKVALGKLNHLTASLCHDGQWMRWWFTILRNAASYLEYLSQLLDYCYGFCINIPPGIQQTQLKKIMSQPSQVAHLGLSIVKSGAPTSENLLFTTLLVFLVATLFAVLMAGAGPMWETDEDQVEKIMWPVEWNFKINEEYYSYTTQYYILGMVMEFANIRLGVSSVYLHTRSGLRFADTG